MSGRVLRAADRIATPWKNGGGETVTIALFPETAGLSDFDWRVSLAQVDGDGPFSRFPGIDRTLTVLSGGSMVLNGQVLTVDSPPLRFDGDRTVDAVVTGGPIHDLNVMTRRGRFVHQVTRVRGDLSLDAAASVRILLALDDGYRGLGRWDALLLAPGDSAGVTGKGHGLLVVIEG